jgi:hypothetical protein
LIFSLVCEGDSSLIIKSKSSSMLLFKYDL